MSDEDLGQSVRFREFVTSRDELRARLHALELEQARLSASLMHLPTKVDELVNSVNALANKVAQQKQAAPTHEHDSAALALHRALDNVSKGGNGSGFERILLLGLVAVVSFMTARFFMGG